jgi:hypothetical protein
MYTAGCSQHSPRPLTVGSPTPVTRDLTALLISETRGHSHFKVPRLESSYALQGRTSSINCGNGARVTICIPGYSNSNDGSVIALRDAGPLHVSEAENSLFIGLQGIAYTLELKD